MPRYLTKRYTGPGIVNPDPPANIIFKAEGIYDPNHDRPPKKQLGETVVGAGPPKLSKR